jgi:hypothetical protein
MRARTNFLAAAFPADTIACNFCRSSSNNVTR